MVAHSQNPLIVITNGNYFARLILDGILNDYAAHVAGVLVVTGDYKGRAGLHAIWELSRVTAWPYILYKLVIYVVFGIAERIYPHAALSVRQVAKSKGIPVLESVSVNTDEVLNWVNSLSPDLLVSVSCPQLIGRKLLAAARLGGINIHSSLLPKYAGLAPYYWVLSEGEQETGTSVHYMTLRFDEGNILVQKHLQIEPNESAFHLFKRLAIAGNTAILEALSLAIDGNSGIQQDLSGYTYFSNPSCASYRSLKQNRHVLARLNEIFIAIREEVYRDQT